MHRPRPMTAPSGTIRTGPGLFVAGTGAGCGKTAVAAGIIHRLQSRGVVAAGMKTVPTRGDAADRASVPVSIEALRDAFHDLRRRADCVVAEGVGEWTMPLGPDLAFPDLARALALPVVLVVDLHPDSAGRARAAASAIRADGLKLSGWIANTPDRALHRTGARLASLKEILDPVPCLGVVDHHDPASPEAVARHLRFDRLMAAMDADETLDQNPSR